MSTVQSVSVKKQGVTESTGKTWTMFQVMLEDGRKASGFEVVHVGEEVSLEQSGKYLNYKKLNGAQKAHTPPQEPPVSLPAGTDGIRAAREHLMQAANLYGLCIDCTEKFLAAKFPEIAHTGEQFQSTLASIWIEASGKRSTDGIKWWSYIDLMPTKPIKDEKA